MSEVHDSATISKPKKSVALSGTPAGETALCTVGRTGLTPSIVVRRYRATQRGVNSRSGAM